MTTALALAPADRVKGANYRTISGPDGLLANLVPFTGNSMAGHRYNSPENTNTPPASGGRLPREYSVPATAVYVVFSYATPLGWVDADGTVTIPDERYSVTTSKQQGYVRAWLGAAVAGTSTHAHHVEQGYRSA